MTLPRFTKNQIVRFIGGTGKIRQYQADSNTWYYTIEMELEPNLYMSRLGGETTILLHEADILEAMN